MRRNRLLHPLPLLLVVVLTIIVFLLRTEMRGESGHTLTQRMREITVIGDDRLELPCAEVASRHPLVLLALGQSNAANHGTLSVTPAPAITIVAEGRCLQASDPLPGGTGSGASIWQRLPPLLGERLGGRPVVVSVLAVDASNIDEWTDADSPLRARLIEHASAMLRVGLPPTLVLWQQGEADARRGLDANTYARRLGALAQILADAGSQAPIMLARSTLCPTPSTPIRDVIAALAAHNTRFRLGPDTDTLSGEALRQGCHFTEQGLAQAAALWAQNVAEQLVREPATHPDLDAAK